MISWVSAFIHSGRSPRAQTLDFIEGLGYTAEAPPLPFDALNVTVPGAPACWCDTVQMFGSQKVNFLFFCRGGSVFLSHCYNIQVAIANISSHKWNHNYELAGHIFCNMFCVRTGTYISCRIVFFCDVIRMFPLPASIAVPAGGTEWGSRACRGGVSCCWGYSASLGKLGCCSERHWEGSRWKPSGWWSCTKIWTVVQKSCPGTNPEGTVKPLSVII